MTGEAESAGAAVPAPSVALGFFAAGFGFLIMPVADALGKQLGIEGIHPIQLSWGRWLANAVIMIPIVLVMYQSRALRPHSIGMQAVRALCLVGTTTFFFAAVLRLPLATVTATLFVAPLLVTALSGVILGERVGPRRWAAVAIGFVGMLLIVRPGFGSFEIGALFALAAATCFAFYLLFTRKIAGRTPTLVTSMWMGIVGVAVMSVAVIPVFEPFTARQWGFVAIMGAVLTFGHCLVIWAADRLEASAMAPMPYMEMITSTLVGFFVFDEFPVATTWIGCALIVAGGMFVAWRESRVRKVRP